MTKENWDKIYASGQQLNRYPYDFIVSNFFRFRSAQNTMKLKVLDLGCGGGNHSIFCAENGAEVLAVDYSQAALNVVRQRAEEKKIDRLIRTQQVDFDKFNIDDTGFDLVIDRLSVTNVSRQSAALVYNQVYDLLNDNGVIFSNVFSLGHTHKDFGFHDKHLNIWTGFTDGIFENLLSASFYSEKEVRELFNKYKLNLLRCESDRDLMTKNDCLEVWKIIAQK